MRPWRNTILLMAAVIAVFLIVWSYAAATMSPWSDEQTHLAVAKSLLHNGQYVTWDFDRGQETQRPYIRGRFISQAAAFLSAQGHDFVFGPRLLALFATLLTYGIALWYLFFRLKLPFVFAGIFTILFFVQSMILEKSLYVRCYAPLATTVLLTMIGIWEANSFYQAGQRRKAALCAGGALLFLLLPTLDNWQIQQLGLFVFAAVILWAPAARLLKRSLAWSVRRWWVVLGLIILFLPIGVIMLDLIMSHLKTANRVMGPSFVTYWDNGMGLLKFGLAANLCFWGIGLFIRQPHHQVKWTFSQWLLCVGLISGILIGLLDPHNFTFFSRYFYISVVLGVIGFAGLLAEKADMKFAKTCIMVYLLCNLCVGVVNLYYDRSNIKESISWVKQHLKQDDLLLGFDCLLELNNGQALIPRIQMISNSQDLNEVRALADKVKAAKGEVYFLFTDFYQFRDFLYRATTASDYHAPVSIFWFLKDAPGHEVVTSGQRGHGLLRFNKEMLVDALIKLEHDQFPENPVISIHKQILKKVLTSLKLPSSRTDLR